MLLGKPDKHQPGEDCFARGEGEERGGPSRPTRQKDLSRKEMKKRKLATKERSFAKMRAKRGKNHRKDKKRSDKRKKTRKSGRGNRMVALANRVKKRKKARHRINPRTLINKDRKRPPS